MTTGTYLETIRRRGLQPFLWTQFLGAFNDNVAKIVVIFLTTAQFGAEAGAAFAGAVFILPFLLFSGYAGELADLRRKQRVLVWTKWLEVACMALMLPALLLARRGIVWPMLAVLFLMAVQSTFFSPAKYGIVPELLPAEDLSRANGLLEMSTFVAIVLGTVLGGEMFERWRGDPWITSSVLVVIAVAGTVASLRIPATAAPRLDRRMRWNPFVEIGHGAGLLARDRTLALTVAGTSFFWGLGALIQLAVLPLGQAELGVGEAAATRLFTAVAIGIGAGSLVAGRLSGDRIELGLAPIGGLGMGLFGLLLPAAMPSYWLVALCLLGMGFAAGLFAVPLHALLQHRPDEREKGRVLATNNVANTIGILLASAVLYLLGDRLNLPPSRIIGFAAGFTILATIYVLWTVPDYFVRFVLWCLTHTVYRIRIVGRPNIPARGPALLVCNHVSMIDGALVGASLQRFVRFIVYAPHFRLPVLHWLMARLHAIPITPGNRRDVAAALERGRAELAAGHVVCIFAEGAVSRTGNLLPFKRGFERMVAGLDVPVIPVYLDRVWGSIFSFKRGRFFWKLPERVPYPVTVAFGQRIPRAPGEGVSAALARQAILELGAEAMQHRREPGERLEITFISSARRHWRRLAMADSTGQSLTYGRALTGAVLLAKAIRARTADQRMVGVLLPASVGGALANIATLMAGKIPVNLNFTAGQEAIDGAIDQCRIRTVLTSKRFLSKIAMAERPGMVFLEDLRGEFGAMARLTALLRARLAPARRLARASAPARTAGPTSDEETPDSIATVIFSSGSTGVPKGVMISHANILSNVDSLAQIFPMSRGDCFIGVLPLFHSFGLTGTLWFPLLNGASVAFHPNPMDAKTIGELAGQYKATMLISTPTFCSAYLRRCTKEQFAHLRYAIVGAEKLREPLAQAFREQFGVELLEGYGCTEMSPVVAVNRPNIGEGAARQIGMKPGSVGHPIPGVAVKVVDRDTGEGPLIGREGLLLVRGPNLMQGYLEQPERTAEVMRDGWYVTGDIASIDEDGFVFITDRLSRFSKIGGEMVPHLKIEETINALIGDSCCAVTAVPDPARGERLVAFYTRADVAADVLWERLRGTELPKFWLPRRECLIAIDAIPTLGTGKVDLRRLKQMALEREAGSEDPALQTGTSGRV